MHKLLLVSLSALMLTGCNFFGNKEISSLSSQPPQIPPIPEAVTVPCELVEPTLQADGTMAAHDELDLINRSDLAIMYCDKKRQLAVDSWPVSPVSILPSENKGK